MDTPFNELCRRLYQFPPNTNDINPVSNMFQNNGMFIVEGQMWTSVLQYFYYQKFIFDDNHRKLALENHDVKFLIKTFYGKLIPERHELWFGFRKAVIKRAMYAKFEQNITLYYMLMNLSDSAINSITDDITIDDTVYTFELQTNILLLEIKEYFAKNGHPLVDTRSGEYKPSVIGLMKKFKDLDISKNVQSDQTHQTQQTDNGRKKQSKGVKYNSSNSQ